MMWKNFFFFSASQRAGIILLIVLIVFASVLNFYFPYFFERQSFVGDSASLKELEIFKTTLVSLDSLRKRERFQRNSYTASHKSNYAHEDSPFRTKKSSRFVRNDQAGNASKPKSFPTLVPDSSNLLEKNRKHENVNLSVPILVELNSADTAELMIIKGIGKGYAHSIIRFRRQTGGFVHVEQLREIYGMTPENFDRIKSYCFVNPDLINKINVNTASVDKLKKHPYLNFYQAKQIYELRRKRGKLSGFYDLKGLSEMNDSTLMKIMPYLSFE